MSTLARNVKLISRLAAPDKRVNYSIKGAKGLYLAVHPTGRKVWYSVYQLGKGKSRKRVWSEIGEYSDHPDGWTLDKAVEQNKTNQAKASTGIDPLGPVTFGQLFEAWRDGYAKKQLKAWEDEERRYNLHLRKPLSDKLISDISRSDVREIRDTVSEDSGGVQSNRVIALFNRVMNWAVDEDRARYNPANRLRKVGDENRRERTLSCDELRRLWHELSKTLTVDLREEGEAHSSDRKGGLTLSDLQAAIATRRAIRLLMLTGQRRGEVIGIDRAELDFGNKDDAWWCIPKERTKNGLPHRVPLTKTAIEIISEALADAGNSPYLFPSTKVRHEAAIRPDAVTKQLQRICKRMEPRIEGLGPHDIRRTIGTSLRKLGVSVEDRGYVFNHISGAKAKVTSWNYDAGEHDDEKRKALLLWEKELHRIIA